MKIGYVRVSKQEQHEVLQIDALKEAGCEKWFLDKMTGSKAERKGLDEALAYLRPGDTLVVWKLDRVGRSLIHLIELLKGLKERSRISITKSGPDPDFTQFTSYAFDQKSYYKAELVTLRLVTACVCAVSRLTCIPGPWFNQEVLRRRYLDHPTNLEPKGKGDNSLLWKAAIR